MLEVDGVRHPEPARRQQLGHLAVSATITGLRTCRNRRGARQLVDAGPLDEMTNGALDPSPIGTSGPSTFDASASMRSRTSGGEDVLDLPIRTRRGPATCSTPRRPRSRTGPGSPGRERPSVRTKTMPPSAGARRQRQPDRLAGVQPDALEGCSLFKVRWWKDSPSIVRPSLGKVRQRREKRACSAAASTCRAGRARLVSPLRMKNSPRSSEVKRSRSGRPPEARLPAVGHRRCGTGRTRH